MKDFQFSFDITSFNNLFPFYILIDKDLKIKSFGKSLKKNTSSTKSRFNFHGSFLYSKTKY